MYTIKELGATKYENNMERAKHSFLLCPILLSCLVMNKTCLNQNNMTVSIHVYLEPIQQLLSQDLRFKYLQIVVYFNHGHNRTFISPSLSKDIWYHV